MKIHEYNQMMAYLTRPATPTLVASAETDALKEKFNEQLGEGTIKTLDELPPVKDPFKEFEDRQQAASGGRIGYNPGGLVRVYQLLKNLRKTGPIKGLEERLIKKFKATGMEFIEAVDKAHTQAAGVRYEAKMKIINDAMKNTDVYSDDYVDLLDMKIKIEDPDFAKKFVKFPENLKNKTRSRNDPDWAEANFGEEYGTKLDQARSKEINEAVDPNFKEPLSPSDQMVSDIDDMNVANTDEFFGRKKNASGGVIGEGGMFQGEDLGNRTGFSGIRKNIESVDGEPYVKTFETGTGAKKYGAFYSRQGFNRRSTFDRTPEGLQKAIEARNKFDLEFEKFKIDKGTLDPAVKKLKNPPDSKKPWRYQRPNKPLEYFATEKQALDFQQKARTAKIEAGTKVPKTDFAKIKKQIINGTTLEELADEYKSGKEAITNLLKNNKTSYSQLSPSESYLDDIDSLKYIEDNYGKLKGETLGKNLYPDLKPSTQISRIRKLSTKLIKQNKLKPIPANLVLETREEKGFNPSESAKKASDDRGVKIKKFSVPAFEAAMSGNFKSQLSHMDDLGSQIVRFETLGYSPQKINQEILKNVDPYLNALYKKRADLLKNKPKGYVKSVNTINDRGAAVAYGTKGYKSFNIIEPGGKEYRLGVDPSKSLDPFGQFEGKSVQEVSPKKILKTSKTMEQIIPDPVERYFFLENAKAVQKAQGKISKKEINKVAKNLNSLGFDTDPYDKLNNLLKSSDKTTILKIRKALKCPDVLASGGRVGLANGTGNLLECPMKKLAADPEGTLNKVGKAVPETRSPIINVLKKVGAPLAKWGGRAFIAAGPAFVIMETMDAAEKFREGEPAGQIAVDAVSNLILPGVGASYELAQKRKMMKDIASPSELAAMEKEDRLRYANMLQEDPLRETDYGSMIEKNISTPEEQLDRFNLEEKTTAAYDYNKEDRKKQRQEVQDQFFKDIAEKADDYLGGSYTDTNEISLDDIVKSYYNEGGRVGYADGPKDPSRRTVIKGLTALATLPIIGKYFKLAKVGPKVSGAVKVAIDKVKGLPDWFQPFVNKVLKEGKDVTDEAATIEREIVKRVDIEDATVDVHYNTATNDVRVEIVGGKNALDEPLQMDYKAPEIIEETGKKTKGSFSAVESKPQPIQIGADDFDIETGENVTDVLDDLLSETDYLEGFATGKIRTPKEIARAKKRTMHRENMKKNPTDYVVDPSEGNPYAMGDYEKFYETVTDLDGIDDLLDLKYLKKK